MAIDLATVVDALNGLRSATVGLLTALSDSAVAAESKAVDIAKQFDLPGNDGRYILLSRLQAHSDDLRASTAPTDARVLDPALSTIKADVIAACIDLNAAVEGQQVEQSARDRIFGDMVATAQGYIAAIKAGATSLVTDAAIAVGVVVGLAVAGFLVYRAAVKGKRA